jgi:hypothetical protein
MTARELFARRQYLILEHVSFTAGGLHDCGRSRHPRVLPSGDINVAVMVVVMMVMVARPHDDARRHDPDEAVMVVMMVVVMVLGKLHRVISHVIDPVLGQPRVVGFHQCDGIGDRIEQIAIACGGSGWGRRRLDRL